MPDESTESDWKLFYQLHNQTQLLEQDISQAVDEEFMLNEGGIADNRKAWFINGNVCNTAALFRQELLALTRHRFPWATSVELHLSLDKEQPYQHVFLNLSPLPLSPLSP